MDVTRTVPEYHIILDPMAGVMAEERDDLVMFSLIPIQAQLDILEDIADDLMNSLTPDAPLLSSYARRGHTSLIAGVYANVFYGLIIGLVIAFLAAMLISRGGI